MQESMLFIAIDTYMRTPRNWLGFKKKGLFPVETPFRVSIVSLKNGVLHQDLDILVRRAKIEDDESWREGFSYPAKAAFVKSWADAASQVKAVIENGTQILAVYDRGTIMSVQCLLGVDPHRYAPYRWVWESFLMIESFCRISDGWFDMLMDTGASEVLISHEEGALSFKKRETIFTAHGQYVNPLDKKNADERAIAMAQNYLLLQEGIKWTKNREANKEK